MSELKSCPFCGAKGLNDHLFIGGDSRMLWVVCDFCLAKGPKGEEKDDAINKWNRRESK